MIDLGRDVSTDSPEARAYPSMVSSKDTKKKKEYRRITLPATILEKMKVGIDDEITIQLECVVKGMSKNDWDPDGSIDLEVREGQVTPDADEEEDKKEGEPKEGKESLLGGE